MEENRKSASKLGRFGRILWDEVKREALWTGAKFAIKKFAIPAITAALA